MPPPNRSKIKTTSWLDLDYSSDDDSSSTEGPQEPTSVESRRPEEPAISHDLVALALIRAEDGQQEDDPHRGADTDSADVSPGDNSRPLDAGNNPPELATEGNVSHERPIDPMTAGPGSDGSSQDPPALRGRRLLPHHRGLSLNTTFESIGRGEFGRGEFEETFFLSASPRSAASNAGRGSLSSPSLSRPHSTYLEDFVFGNPSVPGSSRSRYVVPFNHRRPSVQSALSRASTKVGSRSSRASGHFSDT
jgi:hypothetical protein